ncbi:MAG TPA: hypothetical protein VL404_05490, partial [Candidatus Eisenbacteria bacterium]|nr:hypothetical protein [Candidatus Eisenbacteria bacterium]
MRKRVFQKTSAAIFLPLLISGVVFAEIPTGPAETILLPGTKGRIDHLALDLEGRRLFIAALGHDAVEAVDLASGKKIRSIGGFREPQGVLYLARLKKLYVTNGGNGELDVLDGDFLRIIKRIRFSEDADNIRFDEGTGLVYVGYGMALGIVDPEKDEIVGNVPLSGHPEGFQIERTGARIFVNVPTAGRIEVVDKTARKIIGSWTLGDLSSNFPMALDEAEGLLFVACRRPGKVAVFTVDGRMIQELE